jgi:DNA polymerase I-like protein with 3'-5' exonuclease and polymerase domains
MGYATRTGQEHEYMVEKARTYDILNAGPRKCFTVSGKLVLNCIHGQNYGMGPRLMADMYEMPEAEAKRLQSMYFELFPKIRAWQKSVLDRASRECKLRNPFGYEMPFWEVYRWDSKRQDYILGEDAKSAIAFLPRDTAAAMLKEVLLRLKPLADAGIMLCSTHDSITCEVPESDLMGIASVVKTEMEACVPELDGLSIGVEVKAGSVWHESGMEVLDIATAVTA